jgi:hypothetical protein
MKNRGETNINPFDEDTDSWAILESHADRLYEDHGYQNGDPAIAREVADILGSKTSHPAVEKTKDGVWRQR